MDLSIILYMTNLFKWANVFISFFIILIAYSFFQRTKPHSSRTPWVILFIAVITFFIFEFSNAIIPTLNPIPELRDFFKTLFVAFILYVFVYERHLIEHANKIVIERKDFPSTENQITKVQPSDLKIPSMPAELIKKTEAIQEIKPLPLSSPMKYTKSDASTISAPKKPKAVKKKKTSKK